jgi:hypothetical protein
MRPVRLQFCHVFMYESKLENFIINCFANPCIVLLHFWILNCALCLYLIPPSVMKLSQFKVSNIWLVIHSQKGTGNRKGNTQKRNKAQMKGSCNYN